MARRPSRAPSSRVRRGGLGKGSTTAVQASQPSVEPVAAPTRNMTAEQHKDIMSRTFSRPSSAKPTPVDEEGVPFLTQKDLSTLFGVHPDSVKRWVHTREIPHYVEQKGLGLDMSNRDPMTSDPLQRGTRTWFKHSEIADFLNQKGHLGGIAASRTLEAARGAVARDASGQPTRSLGNDPAHPTFGDRIVPFGKGRRVTSDLTPPGTPGSRQAAFEEGAFTSNIADSIRSGGMEYYGD